jgi:cytochrome c5
MIASWKRIIFVASLCVMPAMLTGCGDSDEGTTATGIALTASTLDSTSVNNHTHSVSLPFSDLGASSTVQYRSSTTSGHSHVIALSPDQLADLYKGYKVQVTSSTADGHTHEWVILGGNLVYESMCFSCHMNSKRGTGGMSGRPPLASQVSALMNPSGQPLSSAPAPVPDPAYNPVTVTPPTGTDGAALYASSCGCHGPLASSTKRGKTAAQIASAISADKGGMGSITLTNVQIQAIADALK